MTVLHLPAYAQRVGTMPGAPAGAPDDSGGEAARTIELTFSSEAPVLQRVWQDGAEVQFREVLGHRDGEVDLARLNSGAAPLLKDHMPLIDSQIGVVLRAWIADGKGKAVVRFSETPAAQDVLVRVRAGDVTCVSVGYAIAQAERQAGDDPAMPTIRVTRWVPKEISFVAIPADPTVGYGRAERGAVATVKVLNPTPLKDIRMDPEETNNPNPAQPKAADILAAERKRNDDIDLLAERFKMPADVVRKAKRDGTSADAFRTMVLDHVATADADRTRAGSTMIGLTEREVGNYSLLNVVRFLENPSDRNRQRAGFEIEASRAAALKYGRDPGGLFIPEDVLMDANFARADALRTQSTATPGAGGNLVPRQYMSNAFIDVLRNKMALTQVGVRMMQGLTGNVDIPKRTAGATLYWFAEDGNATNSASTFALVTMTPHSAGMAVPITRRMMQQGSPDIEALVRDDLMKGMAIGIDRVALAGDAASAAPDGLRDIILSAATEWAGQFPTWPELVALETAVAVENADVGSLAYIYDARTSGHIKSMLSSDGHPLELEKDGMLNGYSRIRTQQAAEAEVYFGNWSDLIIGMWSGIDLRVDTATKAASDGKVLRVFADIDVAVRNAESFALGKRA